MEKFFWADQIADKIIKEKPGKKGKEYVCATGTGLSGRIHFGNFRDVITTEMVVRALKDRGKKVRFVYSLDDFDRFRKVPANVPKEFEKYLGMSVSDFPSPFDKSKSYARYFEDEFEESLKKVGIKPSFVRQNEMYKKGKYAKLIKKVLNNIEEIKKILNKYRKEPLEKDWLPISVYCETCKKDSTRVTNIKDYEIEYECKCGRKNRIDYRKKGLVKLKWRVDWPMRWFYEKVDFEPGGADIGAAGGSYMTGKEIAKKIFDYDAPLFVYYEMINIKGQEGRTSGSKGNIITVDEVLEIYEPEVLRYLFVSTRPNKSFQISFDNDVIKTYDEYDSLEDKYYNKTATAQERRIYELSQIKLLKKKPEKVSFRSLVTLVQIKKTKDLSLESKKRIENVKNWLDKYASDDFKFEVQSKVKIKLGKKQKEALNILKESLSVKDFTEEELFNEFYNICGSVGIKNNEFFQGAYGVIIGKTRGPRLAALILAIGKDKIVKLLEQIK